MIVKAVGVLFLVISMVAIVKAYPRSELDTNHELKAYLQSLQLQRAQLENEVSSNL